MLWAMAQYMVYGTVLSIAIVGHERRELSSRPLSHELHPPNLGFITV